MLAGGNNRTPALRAIAQASALRAVLALGATAAPKRWSKPSRVYQRTLYTRSRTNKPLILELLLINSSQNHTKTRAVCASLSRHRKSLSTLISSPNIVGGGLSEESREWPQKERAHKSSPEAVSRQKCCPYARDAATHSKLTFYARRSTASSARASNRYKSSSRQTAPPSA